MINTDAKGVLGHNWSFSLCNIYLEMLNLQNFWDVSLITRNVVILQIATVNVQMLNWYKAWDSKKYKHLQVAKNSEVLVKKETF